MNTSKSLLSAARASLRLARRAYAVTPTNERTAQDMRVTAMYHVFDALRLRGYAREERRFERARGFAWR